MSLKRPPFRTIDLGSMLVLNHVSPKQSWEVSHSINHTPNIPDGLPTFHGQIDWVCHMTIFTRKNIVLCIYILTFIEQPSKKDRTRFPMTCKCVPLMFSNMFRHFSMDPPAPDIRLHLQQGLQLGVQQRDPRSFSVGLAALQSALGFMPHSLGSKGPVGRPRESNSKTDCI